MGTKKRSYTVSGNRSDGYRATRDGASRASSTHRTQAEAAEAARRYAGNSGGGEVRIQRADGRFRDSDTIGRPDPLPPRDTKH